LTIGALPTGSRARNGASNAATASPIKRCQERRRRAICRRRSSGARRWLAGTTCRYIQGAGADVQGTKDINVDPKEASFMDAQLKKAGKSSDLVIYPDIDHQLRDSAVRTDMLTKADAFLEKTLKL
jgi:hypothetical protein